MSCVAISNRSRRVAGHAPDWTARRSSRRFCGLLRNSPRPRSSASCNNASASDGGIPLSISTVRRSPGVSDPSASTTMPPRSSKNGSRETMSLSPSQSAPRQEIRTAAGSASINLAARVSTVSRSPRPPRRSSRPSMNRISPVALTGRVRNARAVRYRPRHATASSLNACDLPEPGSPSRTMLGCARNAPSRRSAFPSLRRSSG